MSSVSALDSFSEGMRVAVLGAGGGIGSAMVDVLAESTRVAKIYACTRTRRPPDCAKVEVVRFDLEDETSIAAAAAHCTADGPLNLVFVATGVLHDSAGLQPEKSWRALTAGSLAKAFAVNSSGPALVGKYFLPALPGHEKGVFAVLSARVGSIGDNRLGGWYAYRASKAALHMLIATFAIELARRNPSALCVALHPGTVDTELSRPFQSGVPEGKLFAPRFAAERLLSVIDSLDVRDSGKAFAWDGQQIAF